MLESEIPALAITYDELLRRTPFAEVLSRLLRLLEDNYHGAVDLEFTVQVSEPRIAAARGEDIAAAVPPAELPAGRGCRAAPRPGG